VSVAKESIVVSVAMESIAVSVAIDKGVYARLVKAVWMSAKACTTISGKVAHCITSCLRFHLHISFQT